MFHTTFLTRCFHASARKNPVTSPLQFGWRASRTTTNDEVPERLRTGPPMHPEPAGKSRSDSEAPTNLSDATTPTTQFTYSSFLQNKSSSSKRWGTDVPVVRDTVTSVVKRTAVIAYDPNEHPLLCNLDESDDVVLYGSAEQFHENVQRMRNIILTHHVWTISESWYQFLCYVLYASVLYLTYHAYTQQQLLFILRTSRDAYANSCQKKMNESKSQRQKAAHQCRELIEAFSQRKDLKQHRANIEQWKKRDRKGGEKPTASIQLHAEAVEELQIQIRRILLPTGEDYHALVRAQMKTYYEQKQKQLIHPE